MRKVFFLKFHLVILFSAIVIKSLQGQCYTDFNYSVDEGDHKKVHFVMNSNNGSSLQSFEWNFGTIATDTISLDPQITFPQDGAYNVCLSIQDINGCVDTICKNIIIGPNHNEENGNIEDELNVIQGCLASILAEKTQNNPRKFIFSSKSASHSVEVLSLNWSIDGISYSESTLTHEFTSDGEQKIQLTVSGDGCSNTAELEIEVGQENDCSISFVYVKDTINPGHVQFALSRTKNIDEGFWQFDDGIQSEDKHPIHFFSNSRFYNVCAAAIDSVSGCQTQFCAPIQIESNDNNQVQNCFAEFDFEIKSGGEVSFMNKSQGDFTNVQYEFGDGVFSNEIDPTHFFSNSDVYQVCLNIFDSTSNCVANFCKPVNILLDSVDGFCFADFVFFPIGNNKYKFANHSSGNFTDVKWEINNGLNIVKEYDLEWEFNGPGYHEVCLTVYDSLSGLFNKRCKYVEVIDTNVSICRADFSFFKDTLNKVSFNNESSGSFTDIHWDLGDGKFVKNENFVHDYNISGHYEVCLSIFDTISGCQDMICKMVAVTPNSNINNFCTAKFDGFINDNGVADLNNSSLGNFTNTFWEFGDGYKSIENNPKHEFSFSGFYQICLRIRDSITGCKSSYCKDFNVQLDSSDVNCLANFNFIIINDEVKLENTSLGNFTGINWQFGDGENSNHGENVEHIYSTTGVYSICLTVRDSISGCQSSVCKIVSIQKDTLDVFCRAKFEFMHLDNNNVEFTDKSFGPFTNIHWSLGNGEYSTNPNFVFEYSNSGHFDVCLAVMDSLFGCQDQICKTVVIAPDSAEVFCEAKMDVFVDNNGVVYPNNKSLGLYTHSHWEFGDGMHSFDQNPSHKFDKSGYFNVCLSIYDSISGCQSASCENVEIQLDSFNINCESDFDFMVIKNKVTVKNMSFGNMTNAHWAFGDGGFSNGDVATHEYNETGVFDICLGVWDSLSGCQAHKCKQVTIMKDTQDVFCEALFIDMPLEDKKIQFKDVSLGTYTDVKWDLGNGVFSNHKTPIGNYSNPGVYPVKIMIWDSLSGCQSSYSKEVAISLGVNQIECHAKFKFFPINDSLVEFKSLSQGDYTNIYWEFGDGTFAKGNDKIEHVFSNGGFFNVCLGIYDSLTQCHDFVCDKVDLLLDTTVVDCHAEFEFFSTSSTEVTFKNISSGTFTNSFWKFSNGTTSYDENPNIDFGSTGLFGACLTVYDTVSNCQDEFCVDIPIVDSSTIYCDAHFGFFTDTKTVKLEPEFKGGVTEWIWDFGDGFNSNDSLASYTYNNDGVYEVCLTVFDSTTGCLNTYCDQISIITDFNQVEEYVQANFTYYLNPIDEKVYFKDESIGNPNSWYWSFGDGDSAGVYQNPVYEYADSGYYEVCLTVKNNNGGQDTKCQTISIGDVSNACYAKFDYYANAVTATAHLENKSLGRIDSYDWDFGDSINSIQFNPSHTYADTGFYPVCLTVSNDSGCFKTYCREIRIGNALQNKCLVGCVWPGDANLDLEANHYDILPIGIHYGEVGPSRDFPSSVWKGHESQNWSENLWGDVNNKHGDANGDGVIDLDDIFVVEANFAYSHPWQPRSTTSNQLSIDWDVDDIDVGETAVLTVSIPDSLDVTMYGIGFEIDLNPDVFDYATIIYDFSNSWLGTQNDDLVTFGLDDENLGQIYVAETRNDHEELTGNGELVTIYVQAKANSSNTGAILTTEGGVTAEGDTVQFNGAEDITEVNNIEEKEGYLIKELVLFPNPTKDKVTFSLPMGTTSNYVIEIYSIVGALTHSKTQLGGGTVVESFEEYKPGIYTIQVSGDKVKYMQKVVVTK